MFGRHFQLWIGIGISFAAITLVVFVAALTESRAGEIATALGTVIGGSFVLAAAILAWKSIQDQIAAQQTTERGLRREEMLSIAIAIYSEILVLREEVAKLALIIGNTIRLAEYGYDKIDAQFIEDHKLREPTIYPALAAKLGLLQADWVIYITKFFRDFDTAKQNLSLLVQRELPEKTIVFSPLVVLEHALNAVYGVKPVLRKIEDLAGIPPVQDPDVGLASEIVEEERQSLRHR